MNGMKIEMQAPSIDLPCGERLDIPLTIYAMLRGAGGETLLIRRCPKCGLEHRLDLNPLTVIEVDLKPNIPTLNAPLLGNGRPSGLRMN